MTEETKEKLRQAGKRQWLRYTAQQKINVMKQLVANGKSVWTAERREETLKRLRKGREKSKKNNPKRYAARIKARTLKLIKYCRDHRDEVLSRARDPERCRKISETSKAQYRNGRTRCGWADPLNVRQIHPGSNRFSRGYFYSRKARAVFFYRSSWEKAIFEFLESHHSVYLFEPEILICPYIFRGKKHNFVVDIVVDLVDGRTIALEIKPAVFCEQSRNKAKLLAAKKLVRELGLPFIVVNDVEDFKAMFDEWYGNSIPKKQKPNLECTHCQIVKSADEYDERHKAKRLGVF